MTELVHGGSLYKYIHENKLEVYLPRALRWAEQIAYGMAHLHGHSIIHRDLKSSNLLISDNFDATLKICDFGTARKAPKAYAQSSIQGTYRWMAPEVMNGIEATITEKCDVFSYACVLYELFLRRLPYHKETNELQLVSKILEGLRPSFEEEGVPEFIEAIMAQSWETEGQGRPSFQEILCSLETNRKRVLAAVM